MDKVSFNRTKTRIVKDPTQELPRTKQYLTLNDIQVCPKRRLNSLLTCCLTFLSFQSISSLDVESAYNMVQSSESLKDLSHFFWFSCFGVELSSLE